MALPLAGVILWLLFCDTLRHIGIDATPKLGLGISSRCTVRCGRRWYTSHLITYV